MPKVFLVEHKYEADKKVYFVDYSYEADEKVFLVKYAYEADYKAFEVGHSYEADLKVFRVKYAYEADVFKRSSRNPKSTGIFGSSSSSNESSFSTSSSYQSDYATGSENSGCGKRAFYWFVVIILIGWGLQKLGILDNIVSSIAENGSNGKIINTKGLNLRRAAGTEGEIIKLLKQNDSIWQINDSSDVIGNDTWVYVTDKSDTGWVNETYLN